MFKNKYFIAAVLAVLVIGVGFGAHAFGIDATMGAAPGCARTDHAGPHRHVAGRLRLR